MNFSSSILIAEAAEAHANTEVWMREVFGNVPPWSKLLFYVVSTAAMACFAWGVYRRVRLWRLGERRGAPLKLSEMLKRVLRDGLFQQRLIGQGARNRGLASTAHLLLFSGFVVLFIGTVLIAVEHVLAEFLGREHADPLFHKGLYYAIYEVTLDAFGVAYVLGCVLLLYRRAVRPQSIAHTRLDWVVLGLLLVIGLTGYVTEGLRIINSPGAGDHFSFVGRVTALGMEGLGINSENASGAHLSMWWFHALLALGLIAAFPYTRLLHSLAGATNLARPRQVLGTLELVTMEEVEETGRVGVGELTHFSRQQLIGLDACVSCGRCQDACPAYAAGKPLSPRDVVQDVRSLLNFLDPALRAAKGEESEDGELNLPEGSPSLHGDTIQEETLFSCTACSACVDVCPLGISPLGMITDMRRHLIAEGQLRGAPAASLQKTQRSGNPWGLPAQDRFNWAEGLAVPTVEANPGFEVLYWVGCAAAYDRRIQKVARSVVRLLNAAEVNYAVLGPKERCTGESARRMGDEFLFQEMAEQNLETLNKHKVKKILTHCPHCLNSFKHDYSQLGGEFEVMHHSQFLADLVEAGKLPSPATTDANGKVTYHDPCYLARINNVTEEPRQLVQLTLPGESNSLVEMPRHGRETSCCGAGGGRMWFDDAPAQRVGRDRVEEILATGAKTVAVSCPFCLVMTTDGVNAAGSDVQVRDLAELMADALELNSEKIQEAEAN